jgi:restriction system protein
MTGLAVIETYEELIVPLFLRLGGSADQLMMDVAVSTAPVVPAYAEAQVGEALAAAHRAASLALADDVLAHLYAQPPAFFEAVIIDLLLAMGYGQRRRDLTKQLGHSHDGGIDGMIAQDPLGLDVILLQAKRFKPSNSISSSQVRDFVGSLEARRATKGIFFATSEFSLFAKSVAENVSHRVRLVGGRELSSLMVRYNVGVTTSQSFVFKTLDPSYFQRGRH